MCTPIHSSSVQQAHTIWSRVMAQIQTHWWEPCSGVLVCGSFTQALASKFVWLLLVCHVLHCSVIQELGQGLAAVTFNLPNAAAANAACRQFSDVFYDSSSALVGGKTLRDNATGLTNNMQVSGSRALRVQIVHSWLSRHSVPGIPGQGSHKPAVLGACCANVRQPWARQLVSPNKHSLCTLCCDRRA